MAGRGLGVVQIEEAEIRGRTDGQPGVQAGELGRAHGERVPDFAPGFFQHPRGAEHAVDGAEGGAGEVGLAGLADDLVGADLDLDLADGVGARWSGGGGGGVGDVVDARGIECAVEQSEEGGRDVDGIGDEADVEGGEVEDAPEDIVVSVEELGAGIAEVGKARGAGLAGEIEELGRSVGVAEADAEAEFDGESDDGQGPGALRGNGEEQGVGSGGGAQFLDVRGGWIRHVPGVVGTAITGFGGEKGSFEVPAGDGGGQFGVSLAQGAELFQAMDQGGPVVGDKGGEEAAATSLV